MDSNNPRSPSVLIDRSMNIQNDAIKRTSPSKVSNSLKNSPASSEKEVIGIVDQENKPPVKVEDASSSTKGFVFKIPLSMPNADCTLNSLIDGLTHLKIDSTPVQSRRFNFSKWTTPLKRKASQSDISCASSECSAFSNNSPSPLRDEEVAETTLENFSSKKSKNETGANENDDAGSDYYDCGEEVNANDQARTSEISNDLSTTADSSFHSVPDKEHIDDSAPGSSTFVQTNSKPVCEANLAEMNQSENSQQAYILEKYLTEQDFKLEISLSDMSFNSAITNIDLNPSERQSISIQTDNTVSGALFQFGQPEQLNFNDVTIQADQFKDINSFPIESEPTENALFNLITDYWVQNETETSFDGKPEDNIFTLGRISEAAFLHFNTVEEEDALMQRSIARKSLQPQIDDTDSNQSGVIESKIVNSPPIPAPSAVKSNVETEIVKESNEPSIETSLNEITSNMSHVSISAQKSDFDQLSANSSVIGNSNDSKTVAIESNLFVVETNGTVYVDRIKEFNDNCAEIMQLAPNAKSIEAVDSESITTIDEIVVEMNKKLSKTPDSIRRTPSPSSLNATIDTESTPSGSLFEKSIVIVDETTEHDAKQNLELSTLDQTGGLEVSQQFSLEIEDESTCHENANETVDFENTKTINDQDSLKINQTVDLETTRTISEKVEENGSDGVGLDPLKLVQTYSYVPAEAVGEKINEPSSVQEKLDETVNLETTSLIVENPIEQHQTSELDQTTDAEVAELMDGNKSPSGELDEPVNLEITSVTDVISVELESNQTVAFEPEITPVNGEKTAVNESIIDQGRAIFETSQSDILNSTKVINEGTDEVAEYDNFNRISDLKTNETSHDSSSSVNHSLEDDKAEDFKAVVDEESGGIPNTTVLELETGENDAGEEIQQPFELSTTVNMNFNLPHADFDVQNETFNLENPAIFPTNLERSNSVYDDGTSDIPHSPEPVGSACDTDVYMDIEEMQLCGNETVTDLSQTNVLPTSSTERILSSSSSRFECADYPRPGTSKETVKQISIELKALNLSISRSEDTVMIQGSPCPRRSDSPGQFDVHAIPVNEPASPISPNSPTELNNKWQTQIDLSNLADRLECCSGRNSPSNSDDELDVTDPVNSNIAPEMLSLGKLQPGINRSFSNLESIPEMNETDESTPSKKAILNQDVKDVPLVEATNKDSELKLDSTLNQTVTFTASTKENSNAGLDCTLVLPSAEKESKCETGHDNSTAVGALPNSIDSIFKTPITKRSSKSDLSAINDSSFNADYCSARVASADSIRSRQSFVKASPSFFSLGSTPNRKLRLNTPKASGDVPPSLLDMSIGFFENYTATQVGSSELVENAVNKTIDVDEEPQKEETKLLCLEEPSRKVNVKTQTHDTELSDLRAENAKLKEDLNALLELSQAVAENEIKQKKTIQALLHNEAELKRTVQELEDNNRKLINKYDLLTEYSNELLARRNKELDVAEEEIQTLRKKLEAHSKQIKKQASSK